MLESTPEPLHVAQGAVAGSMSLPSLRSHRRHRCGSSTDAAAWAGHSRSALDHPRLDSGRLHDRKLWGRRDWQDATCTAGHDVMRHWRPLCGMGVLRCRTFGLFCEDDENELHRRQNHINQALDICFNDLADMRWASGVGDDNILMTFPAGGEAVLTPRYAEIVKEAKDFGAKLVVIDTAADTFGGNENARPRCGNSSAERLTTLPARLTAPCC